MRGEKKGRGGVREEGRHVIEEEGGGGGGGGWYTVISYDKIICDITITIIAIVLPARQCSETSSWGCTTFLP